MSSSDRITALLASQRAAAIQAEQAAAAAAARTAAPRGRTADEERRANPQPHKVDKSVLRVKPSRGRR